MRLSNLNIRKINLDDIDKSYSGQDILMKLGELYQFESGIYGYGNLWTKLERIVEDIIIDELDKAGCIQVEFPILHPRKIWEQSKRWDIYTKDNDTMFTIDSNLGEYGLAPTAEECAAIFGANRLLSYKNLPATYYQINEKFRKEIRARGFLFRPRTFIMMDAYSFDKSFEDMKKSFDKMHDVYLNIFKRLGINIIPVVSDGGTIGGKVSEEFQALTDIGEDTILYDEKTNTGINREVLEFEERDEFVKYLNGIKLEDMKECNAIELGNNFQLGTKYSEDMKLFYKDKDGKDKPYYMGCYGIGLGRIIACLIENNVIKDNGKIKGFILPYNIAPYKVQIIYNDKNKEVAEELYKYLTDNGVKVIIDDREDLSIGNRIKDTFVLGTPKLIVIGNKYDGKNYEVEDLRTRDVVKVTKEDIISEL
ncbi:MAG: hypothetical protein IKF19_04785 [Bacilli bacterium]|nr:hypothetical protein [Bacilli bacterium]